MKSPRTIAAVAAVALAGAGVLAGCSSAGSDANDGKVHITVASLIPGSDKAAFKAFDDRVKEFEKANPDIVVKSEEYQWTGPTFATQLAGGTLPDVFNVPFTDSQSLIQAGQLADITAEVNKLPYASKFNENVLAVAKDGDKIYGIPYGPYAMGLSYNRDIFTKAGLDPDKPPTTWDEVRADAKTISEKVPGVAGYMQMTQGNTGGWELTTTVYARGGRMETTEGGKTKVTTNNPVTKEALQWLKDLRWKDNSVGSNFLLDWSGINQAFGAGQIAMYPSGSDVLTSLVQQNAVDPKNYGLTMLPIDTSNKDAGVLAGGNVAAVSPKSSQAQKDAAVKWIDFYYMQKLLNQDQAVADAKVLVKSGQPVGVPTLPVFDKATYDQNMDWIKDEINVPQENVAPFTDKIFDATLVPEPNKHTQELYGALDTVVQAVLTDQNADIDQLLSKVDADIQKLVDADK
ncbi:extracellular solute-binding protein [Leifsonia aquatica]|uniref:ABC transporter, solute-binding protein n=2 Tax=Leifsonia aquatica TaxID=144185 RepID=U2RBA8_LEIAQ|nr:extracellular solute-binding protein [Leifsonia aquatica]ERK72515.1 ABC transporter, solute-binding protein [Leifsonia aquatica ATCC 14665]MBB2966299.1 ABC-type glycerol-3-phosphate transport system substrate-binding protein [Leifsonia aquatica]